MRNVLFALALGVSPVLTLRTVIVDMVLERSGRTSRQVGARWAIKSANTFYALVKDGTLTTGAAAAIISAHLAGAIPLTVTGPVLALILLTQADTAITATAIVSTLHIHTMRLADTGAVDAFVLAPGAIATTAATTVFATLLAQACRRAGALSPEAQFAYGAGGSATVGHVFDEQTHSVLAMVGSAFVAIVTLTLLENAS